MGSGECKFKHAARLLALGTFLELAFLLAQLGIQFYENSLYIPAAICWAGGVVCVAIALWTGEFGE